MQIMDMKNKGTIVETNSIVFKDIPMVSPAGDQLVKTMSFDNGYCNNWDKPANLSDQVKN